jgi:hypothetical protein
VKIITTPLNSNFSLLEPFVITETPQEVAVLCGVSSSMSAEKQICIHKLQSVHYTKYIKHGLGKEIPQVKVTDK